MKYFCKIIFFSIFLIFISNIAMALAPERICENLSPSYVLRESDPFILRYFIMFQPEAGIISLEGYLSNKKKGIFKFPINTVIDLTGNDGHPSNKKFVLPLGQKVAFIPFKNLKSGHSIVIDLANTMHVDGGFLNGDFWEKCYSPMGYSPMGYSPMGYSPMRHSNCIVYDDKPSLTCIKEKGYVHRQYATYPPKTTFSPSPAPIVSIKDSFNTSKKITDIYHKVVPSFSDSSIAKKLKKPPPKNKSLSTIIGEKEKHLSSKKSEKKVKICNSNGNKIRKNIAKKYLGKFYFLGLINNTKKINAYWYDLGLSSISKEKFTIDLSSLEKKYIKINPYNYKSVEINEEDNIIPIQFQPLSDMPRISLSKEKNKKHTMNIVVVGDPSSIFISGLEKMEKILSKKSKSRYQWKINWHDVKSDGSLLAKKEFQSFKELIKYTKKEKYKDKILLPKEVEFRNFINSFKNSILNYKNNIDYVIWVKQGYQLPLITPDLFDGFIKNIHNKAKISRFKNGKPYQWLYILSGNMPGRSKILLEEPMRRADPNPGQIDEEEKINMKHRRLLKRPERLSLSLDLAGKRKAKKLPSELDIPSENLFVNAKQVLKKTGLLIPIDHIDSDEKTKGISTEILKEIRAKKYKAASRNNCTHLFFSGKDMGLSWIK